MLDPARGLFIGKDGGLSLAPNPHSARDCQCRPSPVLCALGRINAGLAFFHREPLNASWGRSLIKAVLELELTRADLESVNPEAYEKSVLYICDCDRTALENLALTFADDSKACTAV